MFLVDTLRDRGPHEAAIAVVFTAGENRTETWEGQRLRVALGKEYLVSRLQALLGTGRLHLPRGRETEALTDELLNCQLKVSALRHSRRLRAMVIPVVAAAYFAAVYLGRRTRLRLLTQHILLSAKRIYGVPEFRFYAVADGIKQLLFSPRLGLGAMLGPTRNVPGVAARRQ